MIDQLSLSLYRCLTFLFFPFSKLVIKWRIKTGKEHAIRWREKLGEPSVKKPSGKLVCLFVEIISAKGVPGAQKEKIFGDVIYNRSKNI